MNMVRPYPSVGIMLKDMLAMNPNIKRKELRLSLLGFISGDNLKIINRALDNSDVGILTLEIEDFYRVVAANGEDAGYAVLSEFVRQAELCFDEVFAEGRILAVEKTGLSGYILFITMPMRNSVDFFKAYNQFRFLLADRMAAFMSQVLGLAIKLRIGSSVIRPDSEVDLDRVLFRAFCEAQRIAEIKPESETFTLLEELIQILEMGDVTSIYQPIYNFSTGRILGWEAFSRGPMGSVLHEAPMLFNVAVEAGEILTLEKICRRRALQSVGEMEHDQRLFINVHAQTLNHPNCIFEENLGLMAEVGLEPKNVVFEFSEHLNRKDPVQLMRKLELCREQGFRIAVDDVGAGNSSLRLLSEVRPDYIKADITLIRGIDANPIKRTMVEALVGLAEKMGGMVIAEGVESQNELSSILSMGVHAGQGYFFARPQNPKPERIISFTGGASFKDLGDGEVKCSTSVKELVQDAAIIEAHTIVRDAKAIMGDTHPMSGTVIVRNGKPVGLLMNYNLDKRLGTKFGVSLYFNRRVDMIMDPEPLIVEGSQPMEDVAKAAMNRVDSKIYDDIIIVEDGQLLGTVSVQKMLDTLSQVQVELAKGSNPLTGLPGNVAIEQEVERRTKRRIVSSIMYVDLDNFKVYNDVYGFNNGDRIIRLTAEIIKDAVTKAGSPEDFTGHVGGDDFIIISAPERCELISKIILDSFERRIPEFYNEEDREKGYIVAKGRDGKMSAFGLVSASIGILDVAFDVSFTLEELGHRAAEVKKFAKSKIGNSMVRDRRAPLGAKS
jgi:EAL domain-containing protein (putative c-di-GMP-specific phosphodiesterase class I)/GGDEF domain-containing protein